MTIEVVAVALLRDGRVLAARRSRPAELAGCWEFPGGKVEDGEDPAAALVRECREELAVDVAVGPELASVADGRVRLTLFLAHLASAVQPRAGETHDALTWLAADALGRVGWLPLDRELLGPVASALRAGAPGGTV